MKRVVLYVTFDSEENAALTMSGFDEDYAEMHLEYVNQSLEGPSPMGKDTKAVPPFPRANNPVEPSRLDGVEGSAATATPSLPGASIDFQHVGQNRRQSRHSPDGAARALPHRASDTHLGYAQHSHKTPVDGKIHMHYPGIDLDIWLPTENDFEVRVQVLKRL